MPELPKIHLFRNQGPDRIAIVSVQPATEAGHYLIQVLRGPKRGKLTAAGTFGPVPEALVAERYSGVVASLRIEQFRTAGFYSCIQLLKHKRASVRARAALRLGYMREPDAVQPILDAMPSAVDDVCSMVDALGMLGDIKPAAVIRQYAARKLLSRRRSGAEALRNLGDAEGLAEVKNRALERLAANIKEELGHLDALPSDTSPKVLEEKSKKLIDAVMASPLKDRGLVIDTLYEIGTPAAVCAALLVIQKSAFDLPHLWRYAKSVLKRAALRRDFKTFGALAHAIERKGRQNAAGTMAKLKSGYDGNEKQVRVFGRTTQNYLRRYVWRYLRRLAKYSPKSYAHAAAEVLVHYGEEDMGAPSGRFAAVAQCYALVRILYGGGQRFELQSRKMLFRLRQGKSASPPQNVREEAFPSLWDEEPRAYLRVLSASKLTAVHAFAAPRLAGANNPLAKVLHEASADELIAMLDAPYDPTIALSTRELARRFDPEHPDYELMLKLLSQSRPSPRELGQTWLRLTAAKWTRELNWAVTFLKIPEGSSRTLAVELLGANLAGAGAEARQRLAEHILAALRIPEKSEGEHDALGRVARMALLNELANMLNTSELLAFIRAGSSAAKAVAGEVLSLRPQALAEVGTEQVMALAQHDVMAVRAAARSLMRGAVNELKSNPDLLFMLVESDWEDTRGFAFDLIRTEIGVETLGLAGVIGLCDSNRVDVQNVGKELVVRHLQEGREGKPGGLPAEDVLVRLIQHPHQNMRGFALDLAVQYLGAGAGELSKIEPLCRAILFELWPSQRTKHKVLDYLAERGLQDEDQAKQSSKLLSAYIGTQGRADFERVMEALVRIQLEYPSVSSAIKLMDSPLGAAEQKGAA